MFLHQPFILENFKPTEKLLEKWLAPKPFTLDSSGEKTHKHLLNRHDNTLPLNIFPVVPVMFFVYFLFLYIGCNQG